MCIKQCINNTATFITMQHWHRHYLKPGNSIQEQKEYSTSHTNTAIKSVKRVNALEKESKRFEHQIHCDFSPFYFCNCIQIWDRRKTMKEITTTPTRWAEGKKTTKSIETMWRSEQNGIKQTSAPKWRAIA